MMFAPDAWKRTVDRARIRRNGSVLFGLSVTVLVGWFVLNVLASWVASDR